MAYWAGDLTRGQAFLRLWYGRRSQLDLDRGPCRPLPAPFYYSLKLADNCRRKSEAALVRGTETEPAYLRRFGPLLLLFQRIRREAYKYQKQPPSDHIENPGPLSPRRAITRPKNPTLGHFRIRHPDLQPSIIIVSRSPDSSLHKKSPA